jgi:hypothetical protein
LANLFAVKKLLILFGLVETACFAGSSQNPRWTDVEKRIPARADLNVHWDAPREAIPSQVCVYRLIPDRLPPKIISNLAKLCSFTEQDKTAETANGVSFQAADGSRKLSISYPSGSIHYETAEPHYGPTNLAEGVPPMSQMPKLAADFLRKTGINLSDISNPFDSGRNIESASKFHFSEPLRIYYVGNISITNVEYRTASFWRCVDRIPVIAGDGGQISYGAHGKIRGFTITWRKLERYQRLPSVTPETAIRYLREGKAVCGLSLNDVDWSAVGNVIIKKASPYYYAGHTDLLYPFLGMITTTEPSFGNVQLEIDCPMIDETKIIAH